MSDEALSDKPDDLAEFVQQLTASQSDLRAYILAAIGHYANAEDILQRTNMTLWKKADSFERGTNFIAWAVTVARFEVLRFYRDRRRDRHLFDPDVVELLLSSADMDVVASSDRRVALRECLGRLPTDQRTIVWKRYDQGMPLQQIATETNRSLDAIKSQLLRIRRTLEACVRSKEKRA